MATSYFVICTFDLKNASRDDYTNAYADLAALGLNKVVVAGSGKEVVMPTTTTAGNFNGASAQKVSGDVSEWVKGKFAGRGFKSEIYVVAAQADLSHWHATTT